ncbi:hypothetical protein ACFWWM_15470 [Streptomyces sp. NPDC058682]|uniref:hypothetical protein n=1 Tax=Streptomyces sp. NPDC058682 TaxID=3346596 RepID=UPI0036597E88
MLIWPIATAHPGFTGTPHVRRTMGFDLAGFDAVYPVGTEASDQDEATATAGGACSELIAVNQERLRRHHHGTLPLNRPTLRRVRRPGGGRGDRLAEYDQAGVYEVAVGVADLYSGQGRPDPAQGRRADS